MTPQMHQARQLTRLLQKLTKDLSPKDLADIRVQPTTTTQPLPNQPEHGHGLHISFTVSNQHLSELDGKAQNAIVDLLRGPPQPKGTP